jgi:dTMP kinase
MTSGKTSGLFITFEGVEGSGKSTQARALAERLRARGNAVILTREPGGTPLGDRIRDILLDLGERGMLAETELFLYLASRAEHVARVIVPALERGDVVISDRFGDASVAYQGGGRELGASLVESLNEVATGCVKPDVTFLLDLEPEQGLERLSRRGGGARDRMETEALAFHRRVRDAYLEAAQRERSRFVVLDAGLGEAEIAGAIARAVDELLTKTLRGHER